MRGKIAPFHAIFLPGLDIAFRPFKKEKKMNSSTGARARIDALRVLRFPNSTE